MMKIKRNHKNTLSHGFTLIEIVLATAIIAVLAGLSFSGIRYYDEKMKYSRTEVLIASIESALEEYKADNGSYPQSNGSSRPIFDALYGDGSNVYLATLSPDIEGRQRNVSPNANYFVVDAWGNAIIYRHKPSDDRETANPTQDYDLCSRGPDGKGDLYSTSDAEKADDIKNW
jgi:prepilin-type N-terminal cleavage/methylation domain-containing protein